MISTLVLRVVATDLDANDPAIIAAAADAAELYRDPSITLDPLYFNGITADPAVTRKARRIAA